MAYIIRNRNQKALFPPAIQDYVGTEDPVRAYDTFVESLDLPEMGFVINPYKAGAHEYHPSTLLKLIVYGYSYGERSSRRLERACYHNLSFM
ncbi:MAG: transposase [Planctomycetes bacterium]|nr:transposase [Planctomycetota bacterium]